MVAALWSSTDDNGEPLDDEYDIEDIDTGSLKQLADDASEFYKEYEGLFQGRYTDAGHDCWLTRNGHGAGFWDGDWDEEDGEILTNASKKAGQVDLYVGDDGKIHAYGL